MVTLTVTLAFSGSSRGARAPAARSGAGGLEGHWIIVGVPESGGADDAAGAELLALRRVVGAGAYDVQIDVPAAAVAGRFAARVWAVSDTYIGTDVALTLTVAVQKI